MNKIKTKLWAVFMTVLLLFCMPLTASAYYGKNHGLADANYSDTNPPIEYAINSDQFVWRVNLYVSANPDGKINKN